jgi:plasmid rolling circle replication initiator protein Rep
VEFTLVKNIYLSDVSVKDKPWDRHRFSCDKVSKLYREAGMNHHANRLEKCSQQLLFSLDATNHGELFYRLQSTLFCRVRHCPVCQWRRSLMWLSRFSKVMPVIEKAYPTHRYLFLTITIRNPLITDLRDSVISMNKGWERLTKRKDFPAVGWLKSVEVSKPKDCDLTCHPHFHCILMVPAVYFGTNGGYLSHKKWLKLIRETFRLDYDPSIVIKTVKPKKGATYNGLVESGLREVLKYSTKPEDLVSNPDWLAELTNQLHKTRAISLGGIFKNYIADSEFESETEELIHADNSVESEPVTNEKFTFGWREKVGRYALNKTTKQRKSSLGK